MGASETLRREAPATAADAAAALGAAAGDGLAVRFSGGGTKLGWGSPPARSDLELSTSALDRILEHNAGDLTAVLEPGVPLARAQAEFAEQGQMISLDPPLGADSAATIGGVVAAADSGPVRHRYAGARDLILGVTVALSDGTVARAGGRVIKNVAGYDLAKLFTGSFGTLGLILEVTVRLQPRPERTATAVVETDDPDTIQAAAQALAHSHLDMLALDVRWEAGAGAVLARFGGAVAEDGAEAAIRLMSETTTAQTSLEAEDGELWGRQRAGQRAAPGAGVVVRVAGVQTQLAGVIRAAERLGAAVAGRAALGVSWLRLPEGGDERSIAAVADLRASLRPSPCVVLDAPAAVRAGLDPWHEEDAARLRLTRRVKERFDPLGACGPGVFIGGI